MAKTRARARVSSKSFLFMIDVLMKNNSAVPAGLRPLLNNLTRGETDG
jgi:hypothetical protein